MKIYLDDDAENRKTPEGYVRCFWPQEVIELLKNNRVELVSLDHDLGDDSIGTGNTVVLWIEEQVYHNGFVPPKLIIHSANPVGRSKMQAGIDSINKMCKGITQ